MRVGLIDVDGHNFPSLPLMKISAYHKAKGDSVEWYEPLESGHLDRVYMSKVFSFTPDYQYPIYADEIIGGGSGYAIRVENGKEIYDKARDIDLPSEIEKQFPDYSIYYDTIPETKNTAYGFLTRGCPRGCDFCIVGKKEGRCSVKVADLKDFWNGQKNIKLLDPNMFACRDWRELAQHLIDSKARIDFTQGVDVRIMTEEMADAIAKMDIKTIHFAWDKYEQKDLVVPKLKMFREHSTISERDIGVYVLTNFDTTHEQDIERVETIREIGMTPYVMVYQKETAPRITRQLQRYCNNRFIFRACPSFEEYLKGQSK